MKRLLFVCVENSCRSQMAEAFAHIYGRDEVDARSAGSKPSGIVNPKAVATMAEIGYDLNTHDSVSLTAYPGDAFDAVITMGCGDCPNVAATIREDWGIPDPKHMEPEAFAEIRDLIGSKVKGLLARLEVAPAGG